MTKKTPTSSFSHKLAAWSVHAFTVAGACLGLFTLVKIHQHDFKYAFWLMFLTLFIDSVDGTLARIFKVKIWLPNIDGALLDNIIDYLNYVIVPCFLLFIKPEMLPVNMALGILFAVVITSSYQFCQADAKTPDHFFKGFPCYWNMVVFYMFVLNTSPLFNSLVLVLLCILIFVPIKYVYPSRLDYLTASKLLKKLMHVFSIIYGIATAATLWLYPKASLVCTAISLAYIILYFGMSAYRTYRPMRRAVLKD